MGQVWRAVDEILGRQVAVKLLRSELVEDPEFLDRFRTEGRRTAALSHPGIASVFDYGETVAPSITAFLVMELVEGASLATLLARQRILDPERVLDLVAQVASALRVAHRAGVVHRDIKPSNLLTHDDGVVKLTDFGISRTIGEAPRTEAGMVVGTAAYLSPERVARRPATPAADIYALGVVAYEVHERTRPSQALGRASSWARIRRRAPGWSAAPWSRSPSQPDRRPSDRPHRPIRLPRLGAVRHREGSTPDTAGRETTGTPTTGMATKTERHEGDLTGLTPVGKAGAPGSR